MCQDHPRSSILLSLQQFCQLTYVGVFEVLEETDLTNGSAGSSLEMQRMWSSIFSLSNITWASSPPHALVESLSRRPGRRWGGTSLWRLWHRFPALIKLGIRLKILQSQFKAKHCQGHNGPEGWVHLTKVTSLGHVTSSYPNLDQISSAIFDKESTSKSQPNISI